MPTFSSLLNLSDVADSSLHDVDLTAILPSLSRGKPPGALASFLNQNDPAWPASSSSFSSSTIVPGAKPRLARAAGDFLCSASSDATDSAGSLSTGFGGGSSSSRLHSSAAAGSASASSFLGFTEPSWGGGRGRRGGGGAREGLTSFSEEARDLHEEALEASEEKADAALDEAESASQATSTALRSALKATDEAGEAEEIAELAVMVNVVAGALAIVVAAITYMNYKQWLEVRKERKWCHVVACREEDNSGSV